MSKTRSLSDLLKKVQGKGGIEITSFRKQVGEGCTVPGDETLDMLVAPNFPTHKNEKKVINQDDLALQNLVKKANQRARHIPVTA